MNNKKHKLPLFIFACLLLVITGIIYVNKSERVTTLEFGMFAESNWEVANPNSYVIIDKAIERFEKEHSNVKVHYYSGILKDDYSEWFSKQLLLGKAPDVFMILSDDFNQLASLGVLKNLELLINSDESFNKQKYFSTTLLSGEYQGIQYALPYETVPTLMFVNKTLLEKEGISVPPNNWTWDDLYQICKKVTKDLDGNGSLDQFGTYNYDWMDAIYTNGATLYDEHHKKINLVNDRVSDSVKFTKQLYDLNQGQQITQEDFDSGKVAFMPLPFSEYRTYKTYPYKIKKYLNFQWDCITMPAGDNGGNISEVNTLLLGISDKTQEEELAWEFLKLLTYDEELQMVIFRYSQGVSVLRDVTSSKEAEEIIQKYMEESENVINNELLCHVIEQGTIAPKFLKYREALDIANSEIKLIIDSDKNIDSSIKILQRKLNQYLKQ